MTKYRKFFPRKYYAAADITTPFEATIERILEERMNDGELAAVIYLEGHDKGIVLGAVCNCEMLAHLAKSDDIEDWVGLRIRVEVEPTRFGGKPVMGIRLKPPHRKLEDDLDDAIPGWGDAEPSDKLAAAKNFGKRKAA